MTRPRVLSDAKARDVIAGLRRRGARVTARAFAEAGGVSMRTAFRYFTRLRLRARLQARPCPRCGGTGSVQCREGR